MSIFELFEDFVFGGDGCFVENVVFGFFNWDSDVWVFGDGFFGGRLLFFEFFFVDDLGECDFEVDCGGGVIFVFEKCFYDELGGIVGD